MAEMVGSIVVGEVVNQTSSFLISKHRERLSTREGIERLEMAHIKMEAALELSGRWQWQGQQDTDASSLLRWRRKLRRTADECDAALHRWKLRELQEEDARERLARAPLPRRVASAALRFVSALVLLLLARGGGDDERARACDAVQRFERLASCAAEFLRCVEFGSASPWRCGGLFGPVVGRLGEQHASYERLQGAPQQHRFLDAGTARPAEELWVDSKPCCAYPKRRAASGKKLLLA